MVVESEKIQQGEIERGDIVEFTEDEWTTVYKGTVRWVYNTVFDIDSKKYGRFDIPKQHCRLLEKRSQGDWNN